jgi:outer membrane protein OmpA-like peptidoglycan-associated protein
MASVFRGLRSNVTISLIASGLALLLGIGAGSCEEIPSTATIVNSLTPKALTRSLSISPADAAKKEEEARFINSLRMNTRSLTTDDRDRIATIAQDKPNIDLEINFDFNSDHIGRAALPTVESLGKALTDPALKGNTFILAGHTDAKGSAAYNQRLSERRADAVKRFLIEKYGIPATSLVPAGYGPTRLKNKGNPFSAENRRVAVINMADKKTADK